jgi:hypothetical protein
MKRINPNQNFPARYFFCLSDLNQKGSLVVVERAGKLFAKGLFAIVCGQCQNDHISKSESVPNSIKIIQPLL